MSKIPGAAIEAATEALASHGLRTGTASYNDGALHTLINDVLTAAAPLIAAAEREACAQLAEEHTVWVRKWNTDPDLPFDGFTDVPFADLIRARR